MESRVFGLCSQPKFESTFRLIKKRELKHEHGWVTNAQRASILYRIPYTNLSRVEARMYLPFGENLTNETGGLSSSMSVLRHWPDAVSQMRLKTGGDNIR